VSLDGLDDAVFRRMNDVDFPVADVLEGIEAARAAGLSPIKVNMVVKRGTNEHEILPMARHFRGSGIVLRFIEYMDVGATNGWRMDEVLPRPTWCSACGPNCRWCRSEHSARRNRRALGLRRRARPARPGAGRDRRHQQRDAGFLRRLQPRPPVHRRQAVPVPVCHQRLRPAQLLRGGATTTAIASAIGAIWQGAPTAIRTAQPACRRRRTGARRVEMSYIGG
jgi:cyclic pyranopterin phosphate synthase